MVLISFTRVVVRPLSRDTPLMAPVSVMLVM